MSEVPPPAPRSTGRDALAGFVTGLFGVPAGMAFAAIGGFNPVMGLYSGIGAPPSVPSSSCPELGTRPGR